MKSEKVANELKEIYSELANQRVVLERLVEEIRELRESVTPKTEYIHPWYQVKKQELIRSHNYTD